MCIYEPSGHKLTYTCYTSHKTFKKVISQSKRRANILINLTTQERTQFGPVF